MFKNFVRWFIIFGLSFLVANVFGWMAQGKAFLYINMGVSIFLILVIIVTLVVGGVFSGCATEASGVSFIILLITIGVVVFDLFITWVVTKLFHLDFYIAYQVITFVSCLFPKKKND